MEQDYTVKIFDQFYDLDLVVNASEYDIVLSYFESFIGSTEKAKTFSSILFRVSNITQIPVLDLLNTFQQGEAPNISRTMAYYLNSVSNKVVLYGVNNKVTPNNFVTRNIILDNL